MLVEAERPFVVASSIDYLSATFEFSSEWQGCANTAVFRRQDGTPFSVQLDENNACTVPWEVIQCPYFTVSVFGVCGSKRITTNRVVIKVERCGYAAGETPEDPTPTVYESIIGKLDSMGSAAMCDIGTSAGNVPVLNTDGKIDQSILPGGLSGEESDPIFSASPAHGITAEDIEKWNKEETDPVFAASPAHGITAEDIEKWNSDETDPIFTASPAYGIKSEDIEKWNKEETDPVFTASPAHGITAEDIEKWNQEETDPVFTASPAHGITAEDIEKWNQEETDPVFAASPAHGITAEDIENWNNNIGAGFSGDYNDLTNKPTLTDLDGIVPIEKGGTGAATAAEALANLGADFAGRCKIGVISGNGNETKDHTLPFQPKAVFVFLRNSPFIEYDATNGVTKVNSVFVTADKGGSIGSELFLDILTLSQSQDATGTNGRFLNLNKSGAQYVYFALRP